MKSNQPITASVIAANIKCKEIAKTIVVDKSVPSTSSALTSTVKNSLNMVKGLLASLKANKYSSGDSNDN